MSTQMSDEKGIGLKGWLSGSKAKRPPDLVQPEKVAFDKHRIAVLPFSNISPDPKDEYFADGMTEEMISALSLISGLRVIARTSVMRYKNASKGVSEIGRELRIGSLVEGSVRKAGDRLRATVQLIDAETEEHLWVESFDRDLKDVFAVQSEIARRVSDALRVKLLPSEIDQLKKEATKSVEAHTLYLKGRFQWNKRDKESNDRAIEYFRLAIGRDPNYALAYAGLADCYTVAASWQFQPAKEAYAKAKEAALRALGLNESLAECHASLGHSLDADWNWPAAEKEFQRAIQLNPNYASARQWYSMHLSALDRMEDALEQARLGAEMDPLSPIVATHVGWRLLEMGEYDASIREFEKVLEIRPDFTLAELGLAASYAKKSMREEALAVCQKVASTPNLPPRFKLYLAYIYALCGRKDAAAAIVKEMGENLDGESVSSVFAAHVCSEIGDKRRMRELLRAAYEAHNPFIMEMVLGYQRPELDPAFIELEEKVGLRS